MCLNKAILHTYADMCKQSTQWMRPLSKDDYSWSSNTWTTCWIVVDTKCADWRQQASIASIRVIFAVHASKKANNSSTACRTHAQQRSHRIASSPSFIAVNEDKQAFEFPAEKACGAWSVLDDLPAHAPNRRGWRPLRRRRRRQIAAEAQLRRRWGTWIRALGAAGRRRRRWRGRLLPLHGGVGRWPPEIPARAHWRARRWTAERC